MITEEEVKHLANLARIELSEYEVEKMTKEIDSILDYIGQIQKFSGAEKSEREIGPLRNIMREDKVTHEPNEYTEAILDNAPQREGRFIKVKKVL